MTRERDGLRVEQVRRGDRVWVHGRWEDVESVRSRASSARAWVILGLKSGWALRKRAGDKVTVDRSDASRLRTRRGRSR